MRGSTDRRTEDGLNHSGMVRPSFGFGRMVSHQPKVDGYLSHPPALPVRRVPGVARRWPPLGHDHGRPSLNGTPGSVSEAV